MKVASLVLILRGSKLLLGVKQGGPEIGEGKLNAPGGKFELERGDRTTFDCAKRETEEEAGVVIDRATTEKIAIVTFFTAGVADFEVHIFRTEAFTGEPHETESMRNLKWFPLTRLPFYRMHDADVHWLPRVICGDKSCASVYYRKRGSGFERVVFSPFTDHEPSL